MPLTLLFLKEIIWCNALRSCVLYGLKENHDIAETHFGHPPPLFPVDDLTNACACVKAVGLAFDFTFTLLLEDCTTAVPNSSLAV